MIEIQPFTGFSKIHGRTAPVAFLVAATLSVVAIWFFHPTSSRVFEEQVPRLFSLPFLEKSWLYAALLAFTGFFPLAFGRLPALRFDRHWLRFLRANWPVSLFFIAWDVVFARLGVWTFSKNHTLAAGWLLGLPMEEWLFFLVVPAACVFIYFSLKHFFPAEPRFTGEKWLLFALAAVFLAIGLANLGRLYTCSTAIWCGCFLAFHALFVAPGWRLRFGAAFLLSCIPFLIINGVLTGAATGSPVVLYNPAEFSGLRVGTIPAEDFAYSFLMLLANVTLFEMAGNSEQAS